MLKLIEPISQYKDPQKNERILFAQGQIYYMFLTCSWPRSFILLTQTKTKEWTKKCCQLPTKIIFDNVIRSYKNQIKYAFGRLRASWSILTNQIDLKLDNTPYIIYSCFIIHNFCKLSNIQIVEELFQAHIKETHTDDKNLSIPPRQYFCM